MSYVVMNVCMCVCGQKGKIGEGESGVKPDALM